MTKIQFILTIVVFTCFLSKKSNAQIFVGGVNHSLIICEDSTVMAWGGGQGQVGNGSFTPVNYPVAANILTGITDVSGGEGHSMALKVDGTVWTFGSNFNGELGNGNNTYTNVPAQIMGLSGIIKISAGGFHSMALRNDSTVWIWGDNYYGQLGNGNNTDSNIPLQVPGLNGVVQIVGGFRHSFALKSDGTLWTWGHNQYGQLGNGNNTDSNIPVQVTAISGNVKTISSGNYYSIALMSDSTVWTWGNNYSGDLGIGNNTDSNVPIHNPFLSGIVQIDGGTSNGIALKSDGTVWTWGLNVLGELGNGNNITTNTPGIVPTLTNIVYVISPYFHCHAIKNDGTIWSWGENTVGELGIGNNTDSNTPVQLTGTCDPKISLGVQDMSTIDLSIYPNPSQDIFIVNISKLTNYNLSIYNSQGKVIQILSNLSNKTEIDLTEFESGIYYFLITHESQIYSAKIILE